MSASDCAAKAASRRPRAIRSTGAVPSSATKRARSRSSSASSTSATAAGAASACATRSRRCSTPSTRSPTRRGRRRRQEGLLGRRRSLLPLRHVLHDEVSVRAAASLERRLPAPDAAREGVQASQDGKPVRTRDKILERDGRRRQPRRHSGRRRDRQRGERHRSSGAQAAREDARRASRRAGAEVPLARPRASGTPQVAHAGGRRRSRPATRKGKVVAVRHLLRQSQRAATSSRT